MCRRTRGHAPLAHRPVTTITNTTAAADSCPRARASQALEPFPDESHQVRRAQIHFCFTRGILMVARVRARGEPLASDIDGGSTVASSEVRLRHAKAAVRKLAKLAASGGSFRRGSGSLRESGGSSDSLLGGDTAAVERRRSASSPGGGGGAELATARAVTPSGVGVGGEGGGCGARATGSAQMQSVLGDALLALEAAQEALRESNELVLTAEVRMHHDITVVVVVYRFHPMISERVLGAITAMAIVGSYQCVI